MRVLFLATRDWLNSAAAGGDIQMWEYGRYLAAQGHSVTFVASGFANARKQEVVAGIRVVRLGGELSLWLRTFFYYMRHCRGRYDVVVVEGFGGSRIPRFAPLYVREPIVTEWHQVHRALFASQFPRILLPFLNLLELLTALVHRNTLVRAGTPEWQAAFPSIGFKRENVFLTPVSIREDWLSHEANRVSEPSLVWLGKFRRYKCPHHAVFAMQTIIRHIPSARLILAGRHDDRKYERYLRELVRTLGLEQCVEFRFNLTEEQKRQVLKSCRALALPSSSEGFGIVVLEANACGTPVIASSGVPESVVRNEYNGLRYPFGDTHSLVQCVIRVLKDDALYARLSDNGRAFVQEFTWEKVGRRFEEVLEQALDRAGRKG